MTDEITVNLKELKEEIWAEFGDQLRSYGASGVQDFILTIGDQPLPPEEEVSEDRCIVHTLGHLGKYEVLAVRCACKVGKTAVGLLMVFVTLTSVPDSIEQSRLMFPNTYEVGEKIASHLQNGTVLKAPEEGENKEQSGIYIAYDPEWAKTEDLFQRDWTMIRQGQNVFQSNRKFMFLPSSISYDFVVSGSSLLSDDDETA